LNFNGGRQRGLFTPQATLLGIGKLLKGTNYSNWLVRMTFFADCVQGRKDIKIGNGFLFFRKREKKLLLLVKQNFSFSQL